jgi:hypothetical protein
MGERLGKTGVAEVVAQPCIGGALMLGGPSENPLRDGFQRVEMACGVSVAPGVICDDGFATAEKLDQFGMHGARAVKPKFKPRKTRNFTKG